MFSLQRIFGKKDRFFGLLESSAQEARKSVQTLVKLGKDIDNLPAANEFNYSRQKDKEITNEIRSAVYSTFVTAFEREDIEGLSNAIYKIPKTVEKFSQRVMLAPQHARGVDFSLQIKLLEQATDIVVELVQCLRDSTNLDKVKELNDRLQCIEAEADSHMMDLYKDLFSGKYDAVRVIVLKDLFELLEKIIDRCRDAGNMVAQIVLKNS